MPNPPKLRAVRSAKVPDPKPNTWSNCKVCGNQVFIAGMMATDAAGNLPGDGSPYAQAKAAFAKVKHLIEAAGGKMDDIARLDIHVTDIARRQEVWRARAEFFTGDFPTSTLVEVKALANPKASVEITAQGFIGAGAG